MLIAINTQLEDKNKIRDKGNEIENRNCFGKHLNNLSLYKERRDRAFHILYYSINNILLRYLTYFYLILFKTIGLHFYTKLAE